MLCQQLLSTTGSRASLWEDKVFLLFEKWEILSQGPVILLTASEDHQ